MIDDVDMFGGGDPAPKKELTEAERREERRKANEAARNERRRGKRVAHYCSACGDRTYRAIRSGPGWEDDRCQKCVDGTRWPEQHTDTRTDEERMEDPGTRVVHDPLGPGVTVDPPKRRKRKTSIRYLTVQFDDELTGTQQVLASKCVLEQRTAEVAG